MAEATRETQIGIQSRYLIEQLERVANELKHLKERLAPVLSPLMPAAEVAKGNVPTTDAMAPHAIFLRDQGNAAKDLADEIAALRQRVEL